MAFSIWDWLILVVYLLGIVAIGLRFSSRQTSSDEFFLGSRRFGAFTISLSVLATSLSAITFVGIPGLACAGDWSLFLAGAIAVLSLLVVARFFLPFFYRLGLPSIYDYLERRFDRKTAFLGGMLFLMVRGLLAAIAIYAPSVALCAVTGWNLALCIFVFGFMTLLYTAFGGMSAVVWTDVIQVAVLFGGAFVCVALLWQQIALSPAEMLQTLNAENKFRILDFRWSWVEMTFWTSVIGGFIYNLAFYGTDQVMIQRCLASKSLRASRQSLVLNACYLLPVSVLFFMIGSLLYLFRRGHPNALPAVLPQDQIFPYFIAHQLPAGLAGLLIAAVFAAAMSTLSSVLNSLATVTVTDFYRKYFRPGASDRHYTRLAKLATLGWGLLAIGLALVADRLSNSVMLAALKAGGLFTGPVLGLFVAGIFLPHATANAAFTSALLGQAMSLGCGFGTRLDSFWVLVLGCVVTLVGTLLLSFLHPAGALEQNAVKPYTWKDRNSPLS